MSDISRRRRIAGRLLLGTAAIALPLTASVSYAAGTPDEIESVDVAPSVAAVPAPPAAPAAPLPPAAPLAPDAPVAPEAPVAPKAEKNVQVFKIKRKDGADGEQVFAIRADHKLSEAQRRKFEEMGKKFASEDWEKFAERQAKMAEKMAESQAQWTIRLRDMDKEIAAHMASVEDHMPLVEERCDDKGTTTREWTDDKGRKHIMICEREIQRVAMNSAAMGLRQARASIAANREMSADVRDEVLQELDAEIERIESGKEDS